MTKRVITTPTKPADYHRTALTPDEWRARQKALHEGLNPAADQEKSKGK